MILTDCSEPNHSFRFHEDSLRINYHFIFHGVNTEKLALINILTMLKKEH